MRSFTSARPAWSASSTARAAARSVLSSYAWPTASRARCPARCGSSRPRGRRRWSAPACRLAQRRLADLVGQLGGLDPGPVVGAPSGSSSPSSLRIAASCWRSRNSRWDFSSPSRTSLLICSADLLLGQVRLRRPSSAPAGRSTSGPRAAAPCCGVEPGRVTGRVGQLGQVGHPLHRVDDLPGAPLLSTEVTTALYSRASSRARRGAGSSSGSPRPRGRRRGRARRSRSGPGGGPEHGRGLAAGSRPTWVTSATAPIDAGTAVDPGHEQEVQRLAGGRGASGPRAASRLAWAWSVSSTGTTMPGRTTSSSRNSTGKLCVLPALPGPPDGVLALLIAGATLITRLLFRVGVRPGRTCNRSAGGALAEPSRGCGGTVAGPSPGSRFAPMDPSPTPPRPPLPPFTAETAAEGAGRRGRLEQP